MRDHVDTTVHCNDDLVQTFEPRHLFEWGTASTFYGGCISIGISVLPGHSILVHRNNQGANNHLNSYLRLLKMRNHYTEHWASNTRRPGEGRLIDYRKTRLGRTETAACSKQRYPFQRLFMAQCISDIWSTVLSNQNWPYNRSISLTMDPTLDQERIDHICDSTISTMTIYPICSVPHIFSRWPSVAQPADEISDNGRRREEPSN